jgi:hypothetical protein
VLEIIHDEHNDDKMILRVLKNNLAKKPAPLGFQVVEDENGEAVIEWQGELDEELSITPLKKRNTPKIDRTIEFLERTLANGPVSSSSIKISAQKENIKEATLRKAREKLQVEVIREGNEDGLQGSAGTSWTLPVALSN